jgi:hypothetical protein
MMDLVQVHTNFEIGRRIVQEEQLGKHRAAHGKQITQALAERLTAEFGKGFSDTNLKLMRLFYLQNKNRIQYPSKKPDSVWPIGNFPDGVWSIGPSSAPPLHSGLVALRLPPRHQESGRCTAHFG